MMGSLSNYYTVVQGLLTKVSSATLHDFAECEGEEERVAFVQKLEGVDKAFNTAPLYQAKNAEDAKKWRERGNSSYQMNQLQDALVSYNMSILLAPKKTGQEELALAIGNRSAVFWQMSRYEDAVEDTQLAIESGYPKHLVYKVYDRRGRCFQKLGKRKASTRAFKKALEFLPMSTLDAAKQAAVAEQVEEEVKRNAVDDADQNVHFPETTSKLDRSAPTLGSEKANMRYPSGSKALDVLYTPNKGRYVIAVEDVQVGDVVAVEIPYVSVLEKDFYSSHCYHCFKPTDRVFGCQQCGRVRYCSVKCSVASWSECHQWECQFLDLLASSGTGCIAHLAMRAIVHTGLKRIIHCKRNPKSQRTSIHNALYTDSKGVYRSDFIGVHNLVSHSSDRSPSDHLQYTFLAIFLLNILENSGFFTTAKDKDFATSECVGGLLLRFLMVVACNGIEITRLQGGANLLKCNPQTMGLALYPTISLFNHSCNPALEMVFYGRTCVLRALRPMLKGEELTVDYGYIYYLQTREQRQLSLRIQYFFECDCEACARDWGLKNDLPSGIACLKCAVTGCSKPLPLLDKGHDPASLKCPQCGKVQNSLRHFEALHESSRKFEKAYMSALNWNVKDSLPTLVKHVQVMDKHIRQPWKEYATCVSIVKQCFRAYGNTDQKLKTVVKL